MSEPIKTKIPAEMEPAAVGGMVTDAKYIIDRVKNKNQTEVNVEVDEIINNVYLKSETYNKTELNNMITTPNQKYVTVIATDQTTAVTDVLPDTGAADTVYRVGNWDGSQFDASVYSEYAWNGSSYVHLNTKTQIGEVFDISAYHATGGELAKYANLAAALDSNNGGGVPQSLQNGGMSVKFVSNSGNNYVQFRCKTQSFSSNSEDWYEEFVSVSGNIVDTNLKAKSILVDGTSYNITDDAAQVQLNGFTETWEIGSINAQGNVDDNTRKRTDYIPISEIVSLDIITLYNLVYFYSTNDNSGYLGFWNSKPVGSYSQNDLYSAFTNAKYIRLVIKDYSSHLYTFKIYYKLGVEEREKILEEKNYGIIDAEQCGIKSYQPEDWVNLSEEEQEEIKTNNTSVLESIIGGTLGNNTKKNIEVVFNGNGRYYFNTLRLYNVIGVTLSGNSSGGGSFHGNMIIYGCNLFSIKNLYFVADYVNERAITLGEDTTQPSTLQQRCQNLIIEDCTFLNYDIAIDIAAPTGYVYIRRNHIMLGSAASSGFQNDSRIGIRVGQGYRGYSMNLQPNYIFIDNCGIEGGSNVENKFGIYLTNCFYIFIRSNDICNFRGGYAIYITGNADGLTRNIQIIENILFNNKVALNVNNITDGNMYIRQINFVNNVLKFPTDLYELDENDNVKLDSNGRPIFDCYGSRYIGKAGSQGSISYITDGPNMYADGFATCNKIISLSNVGNSCIYKNIGSYSTIYNGESYTWLAIEKVTIYNSTVVNKKELIYKNDFVVEINAETEQLFYPLQQFDWINTNINNDVDFIAINLTPRVTDYICQWYSDVEEGKSGILINNNSDEILKLYIRVFPK